MIPITQTTDALKIVLTASVTTNQLSFLVAYRDDAGSSVTAVRNADDTNNTTAVNLIPSPSSGHKHLCDYINIFNSDTASAQVTVYFDANGTQITMHKVTLAPGERTEYTAESGWNTYNTSGSIKTSVNPGLVPVTSSEQMVILETDVVNNEAVANTLKDVTGLSFDVVAGSQYYFEFIGFYTSAATTTGSRWVINGPTVSALGYESQYTLSATAITQNQGLTSYNQPASSSASSIAAHNTFILRGWITPATDGTVQLRFASEVSASAITCKAWSFVRYIQLT